MEIKSYTDEQIEKIKKEFEERFRGADHAVPLIMSIPSPRCPTDPAWQQLRIAWGRLLIAFDERFVRKLQNLLTKNKKMCNARTMTSPPTGFATRVGPGTEIRDREYVIYLPHMGLGTFTGFDGWLLGDGRNIPFLVLKDDIVYVRNDDKRCGIDYAVYNWQCGEHN